MSKSRGQGGKCSKIGVQWGQMHLMPQTKAPLMLTTIQPNDIYHLSEQFTHQRLRKTRLVVVLVMWVWWVEEEFSNTLSPP